MLFFLLLFLFETRIVWGSQCESRGPGVILTAMSMAEDERTKKIFSGTFNKHLEIVSAVERMVLPGGSKLRKRWNLWYADTLTCIIHDTAMCLHSRLDRNLPTSPVLSLRKFRSSVKTISTAEEGISPIGTYTPRSCSFQISSMLLALKSFLFFCLDVSTMELFEFQTAKGMENI